MNKDYPVNTLDNIGFVCIESKYEGKWVLSYHSRRNSWEVPGGHVEEGEKALTAAKRELYEETGAIEYDIEPVWDYQALNSDGSVHNNGRVYFAEIKTFEKLPEMSEMKKVAFFDDLPDDVTYNRENMKKMLIRAENEFRKIILLRNESDKK